MSTIKLLTLETYLEVGREKINLALKKWVDELERHPLLHESIAYSLLGSGKRIRPLLMFATLHALGKEEDCALEFACAIELIHTYSLIHDDLPCMDNDDYRRGKPTAHKAFGEAHALLTGDALLTEAFHVMSRARNIEANIVLKVIQEGAYFSGARGMVGGQALDVSQENPLTQDKLDEMYYYKTACLFVYAVRTGAHISKATEEQLEVLTTFAQCLGLAFQIQDDILDVIGNSDIMGKAAGSDQDKKTYPYLLGLKASEEIREKKTKKAIQCLQKINLEHTFLSKMADFLLCRSS